MSAGWALLVLSFAPLNAFASFLPSTPFASDAAGTTGAAFLKLPVGARAQALAETYAAVAGDTDSLYWNPAGLALMHGREISASYNSLLETAYTSALAYAMPARKGVLGLGVLLYSQSPLEGFNKVGDATGEFTPYDISLTAGWAKASGDSSGGASFKVIRQSLAGRTALGWALDLGWQSRNVGTLADKPVDIGYAVRNLGSPIKLGSMADPLPLSLVFGALWRSHQRAWTVVDFHLPVDHKPYASLGEEWRIPAADLQFALRAGYSFAHTDDIEGLAGITAGGGVSTEGLRLDYAWAPMGFLGSTHRMTVGFHF